MSVAQEGFLAVEIPPEQELGAAVGLVMLVMVMSSLADSQPV